MPLTWDISRYRGDHLFGSYQIQNIYRPVVDIAWWPTRKKIDLAQYVHDRIPEIDSQAVGFSVNLPGESLVLQGSASDAQQDIVVIWQNETARRAAMIHLHIREEEQDEAELATMLSSICVPNDGGEIDWAAFDFHIQSPAGFQLKESSLAAGTCGMTFHRRFARLSFQRYSAADTLLHDFDIETVNRWLRFTHAGAFHDMRYELGEVKQHDDGLIATYQATRRGLGAIEWQGLFPRFRRNPTELVVHLDQMHNRITCFERNAQVGDEVFQAFITLASYQCLPISLNTSKLLAADDTNLPSIERAKLGQLRCKIRHGDDVQVDRTDEGQIRLRYVVKRPARLRMLRMLAALPLDSTSTREVELDAIGSFVWNQCAESMRIIELIEAVMLCLSITAREAEITVMRYVELLATRGLLQLNQDE